MSDPTDEWRKLSERVAKLAKAIAKSVGSQVRSDALRGEARAASQQYFRQTRPVLLAAGLNDELELTTQIFDGLLRLSERAALKTRYAKLFKTFRSEVPDILTRLERYREVSQQDLNVTIDDQKIIETLQGLLPTAAFSYQQAIADLTDERRVSFRGPALELREAFRETLDHLAPDADVEGADGYKREPKRDGPTMKQKVRFIRKARGQSKSSGAVPEQTAATIDELVSSLSRSVYEQSSVATHVAKERKAVLQIKRYIVAILHEILEI